MEFHGRYSLPAEPEAVWTALHDPDVLAAYRARRYATSYKIADKWPEDLWAGLGKDFALLSDPGLTPVPDAPPRSR